jgi:3-hydroxyisobutyrate dehydrogenase-like beta-hydroxyacid dehydrogenase
MKEVTPATVGIVGFGRMGAALGGHLRDKGWTVVATDPDPEARVRATSLGITPLDSAAEVGARADVTLVVVVDDAQTVAVCRELMAGARPDSIVAICSSVRPETCISIGKEAAARRIKTIDVALVRGERGAEEGALALYCGGDAEIVDACRELFAAFATDVCHLGPLGSGQIAKTVNNILLWACLCADVEALRLGRALGLEPARLRPALAIGSGANRPLAEWGQHRLRWPKKDLENALALAEELDLELPLARRVSELMARLTVEELQALR